LSAEAGSNESTLVGTVFGAATLVSANDIHVFVNQRGQIVWREYQRPFATAIQRQTFSSNPNVSSSFAAVAPDASAAVVIVGTTAWYLDGTKATSGVLDDLVGSSVGGGFPSVALAWQSGGPAYLAVLRRSPSNGWLVPTLLGSTPGAANPFAVVWNGTNPYTYVHVVAEPAGDIVLGYNHEYDVINSGAFVGTQSVTFADQADVVSGNLDSLGRAVFFLVTVPGAIIPAGYQQPLWLLTRDAAGVFSANQVAEVNDGFIVTDMVTANENAVVLQANNGGSSSQEFAVVAMWFDGTTWSSSTVTTGVSNGQGLEPRPLAAIGNPPSVLVAQNGNAVFYDWVGGGWQPYTLGQMDSPAAFKQGCSCDFQSGKSTPLLLLSLVSFCFSWRRRPGPSGPG